MFAAAAGCPEMALNQEQTLPSERRCPSCGLQVQPTVVVCPRDGTNLIRPLYIDPAFSKYEFISGIGAGGMGVIYKARHINLNRMVAIKTLHSHLASPEAVSRFEIEGKAASLLSHPNIIAVYDIGVTQAGQPYMVMDYVDGHTMSELLQSYGQIPLQHFLTIFLQVTDALSHAHKRSVLHRDIKPSNLMLIFNDKKEYEVRIMDFGIAKVLDDTVGGAQNLTKTGEAIGSPIYMSPEQARGQKMDHRSDLYSLGCVMYEALTGSVPFLGNTSLDTMLMHMEQSPMPMREASLGKDLDPRLEHIVMKLLKKNPADRYQSMDELHKDLLSLQDPGSATLPSLASGGAQAATSSFSTRGQADLGKPPSAKGDKLLYASLAVALLSVCLPVYFYLNRSQMPMEPAPKVVAPAEDQTLVSPIPKYEHPLKSYSEAKKALDDAVDANSPIIYLSTLFDGRSEIKDSDLVVLKRARMAKVVNLSNMPVSDVGLDYLCNSHSLRTLQVSGTRVKTLRALKFFPSLQILFACSVQLDPVAYKNIGKLPTLEELYLENNSVTDADLLNLTSLRKLHGLDLNNCTQLTALGIDKLKNEIPNCEIRHQMIALSAGSSTETSGTTTGADGSTPTMAAAKLNHVEGPMPSFQEAKSLAAAGKWSEANEKVTHALDVLLPSDTPEADSQIYALKGDCQMQLKFPRGAAWYYVNAIKKCDPAGIRMGELESKLAAAYEAFPEQPDGFKLAVVARMHASQAFKEADARAHTSVASTALNDNMDRLIQDCVRSKDASISARYLDKILADAPADRKERYSKMLRSIGKSHSAY